MATKIDQKAYLQKYLSGPSGSKKKKKKKVIKGKGLNIIDEDIDISKLRPLEGDELDVFGEGEDAPQVAGIIDERPEDVRKLEQFQGGTKWRVINQDDGFNSKLQIEEIKRDVKEAKKENEYIFGKMYSDTEDEKNEDSDASPPRKQAQTKKESKKHQNSDGDLSPPRRKSRSKSPQKKNYDSDLSPPRKSSNERSRDRIRKPSRWGDVERRSKSKSPKRSQQRSDKKRKSNNYDSDLSPPRKSRKESPIRSIDSSKRDRQTDKQTRSSDSPPRKTNKQRRKYSDSDASPPRKRDRRKDNLESPPRNKDRYRENEETSKREKNQRKFSDSDESPPRRDTKRNQHSSPTKKRRSQRSDSDESPPRKQRNLDSPPPSNKKMAKTLEGKLAGLQDAKHLRQENEAFRRREEEVFKRMTDDVSGRNAQAVSRKGKRETSEERRKQKEKSERQKILDEKYKKWNRGLKQVADQESRHQDFLHESSKPLARLKDDVDLERSLKVIDREGDPMLRYIRDRKRERGELGPEKPMYKGNFAPNRFNIRPGYRWDGVDRSNGYEKKFFEQQSKRKAMEEERYKWSTEDL